jgi:hypothetical protein
LVERHYADLDVVERDVVDLYIVAHRGHGFGDLDRDADRKCGRFHRSQQPLLAFFKEVRDAIDIFGREPGLRGNASDRMTPPAHSTNVVQQVERAVMPTRTIFDQAGDQAFLGIRCHDQRGHFSLAEMAIGFQPPLPADEIVACVTCDRCAV